MTTCCATSTMLCWTNSHRVADILSVSRSGHVVDALRLLDHPARLAQGPPRCNLADIGFLGEGANSGLAFDRLGQGSASQLQRTVPFGHCLAAFGDVHGRPHHPGRARELELTRRFGHDREQPTISPHFRQPLHAAPRHAPCPVLSLSAVPAPSSRSSSQPFGPRSRPPRQAQSASVVSSS